MKWCLEHGTSVLPRNQKPWPLPEDLDINNSETVKEYFETHQYSAQQRSDVFYCPPILELAASVSTVATFELLRSKGAPLGWRVLHKAVSSTAGIAVTEKSIREQRSPSEEVKQLQLSDREIARTREERMAMVRYLVDTLKVDVNTRDQPPGWMLSNHWGRPLHYVAHSSRNGGDCKEVTLFLLERGADLELLGEQGMAPVAMVRKGNFLDVVNEWRLAQTGEAMRSKDGAA